MDLRDVLIDFEELYMQLPTAGLLIDDRAVVLLANHAASELLELERSELEGNPLSGFLTDKDLLSRIKSMLNRKRTKKGLGFSGNGLLRTAASAMIPCRIQMRQFKMGGQRLHLLNLIPDEDVREAVMDHFWSHDGRLRFELALEAAGMGAWEHDAGSDTNVWGERMFALYGAEPTDFKAENEWFRSFIHPDDREGFIEESNRQVLEGKEFYDLSFRIIRKNDGKTRWIREMGRMIRDRNGKLQKLIGLSQDITQEKGAEDQLIREKEKAQQYLDVAGTIFLVLDANGRVEVVNKQAERILGYKDSEIIGKNWFDHFLPEGDREQVRQGFEDLIQLRFEEEITYYENEVLNNAGEIRLIAWHNTLIRDDQGKVVASLSSGIDITDSRKASLELDRTINRLKQAQQIGKIGHWEYDLAKDSIEWSEQVFELFGRDPALGEPTYEENMAYYTPESRLELERIIKKAESEGASEAADFELRLADGRTVYQHSRVFPKHNANGDLTHLSGTVQDITERKQAELHVEQLKNSLEERVLHRTMQLEAANQELESFSYSVSHDLRTPLRALDGFSRILHQKYADQLDEKALSWLDMIRSNAVKMDSLIQDMLNFSKIGRHELDHQRFDMKHMMLELIAEQKIEYSGRNIKVELHDLPLAYGDPTILRQLCQNLISNAFKYSSKNDDILVHISGIEQDGECIYTVQDNGVGFDPSYSDKMFGVFQRLVAESEFEGTGVGLAIAERVIKKHNGRIWAESMPGEGASFHFSLPMDGVKDMHLQEARTAS